MHVLDMPEIKNTASPPHPFRCVFLTLPNYSLIALSSAVEALRMANRVAGQEAYQWSIASMGGHPVAASNGLALAPTVALADVAQAQMVLVCGGIESEAYENELRALAQGLPVTFHGRFTAAQLHAVRPHCGVFPSMCIETFGFVLDECFELGLPCITSDIGALPERSRGAGLVTKAGDADSIAEAMTRLVNDRPHYEYLRAGIPAPGPTMVEHNRQIAAIYQEAWSTPGPTPCAPEVPWLRRVRFLMQQRDHAFSNLMPKDGFR